MAQADLAMDLDVPRRELVFGSFPIAAVGEDQHALDAGEDADGEYDETRARDDTQSPESPSRHASVSQTPIHRASIGPVKIRQQKKSGRVKGGHAPTSKRVVIDYDSEDQIIVDMKQQGYHDNAVCQRLIDEGRTRYQPLSISSRWQRIRRAIQAAEDELLDEELTDWHDGEDDLLRAAYTKADIKVTDELERIRQKRFTYVAQEINKHAKRPRFSAKSCKNRYEALQNGTARCPPELDPDPEARKRERDERRAAFKIRKAEEAERKAIEDAEAKRLKSKTAQQKEAARLRREEEARIRVQKKQEEDAYKKAKLDAIVQKRTQKQDTLQATREKRIYTLHKQRVEKEVVKILQSQANQRARVLAKHSMQFPLSRGTASGATKTAGKNAASYDYNSDLAAVNARSSGSNVTTAAGSKRKAGDPDTATTFAPSDNAVDIFGDDPRAIMTMKELYAVMRSRGMLLNRMKEVKTVMLSRLQNEDNELTLSKARKLCKDRGLATSGTKEVMVRRIQEEDAKTSSHFKKRYGPKPPKERKNTRTTTPAARRASAAKNGAVKKSGTNVRYSAQANPDAHRYSARDFDDYESLTPPIQLGKPKKAVPVATPDAYADDADDEGMLPDTVGDETFAEEDELKHGEDMLAEML